jgi:predicted nucleotidyltransferase
MEQHHRESIERFLEKYGHDQSFRAILLGGSIAHGFAKPDSDIDVLIVADEAEYERRKKEHRLAFSVWDVCTYEGGYVDCKVVSRSFMELVAERGSDPARYAFKDCRVLVNRTADLEALLARVTAYPVRQKADRRERFVSQLLAWKWYYGEALRKDNPYLVWLSLQKIVLFACRIVLNENETLYPYHKWLLAETKRAANKPERFDGLLDRLLVSPDLEAVRQLADAVLRFSGLTERDVDWPNRFLLDSEWNWIAHEPPVDDL